MMGWITKARMGGDVERMHTIPTLKKCNVAEHSFNAAILAIEICNKLEMKFAADAVVSYLLIHDIPEHVTGDIPGNIKKEHEALKRVMTAIEEDWEEENIPFHYMRWASLTAHQKTVAKASDVLELMFFCMEEVRRGNNDGRVSTMFYKAKGFLDEESLYEDMSDRMKADIKKVVDGIAKILAMQFRRYQR